jgi:hypothetical protein
MAETTLTPLLEAITEQLKTLSEDELRTIQDFVDYLIWKHHRQTESVGPKKSTEARAIERLKDLDDPTKWVTVIEEGQEIDIETAYQRLRERGFPVEMPDESA